MDEVRSFVDRILGNVGQVIIGKESEIRLLLIALLCRGHVLINDVPGVGKTMLAKALAKSLGCSFKRIQFTPDMLPSDITGVSIYDQKSGEFRFRPGPVMAQIVLTDEINRATPKTQSALLEAMEERQVTVDGVTHSLPEPFIVLATQNPIEYEGTFPLPEAQLDRFLMRLALGYPNPADEQAVLIAQRQRHPIETIAQVAEVRELMAMQERIKEVHVDEGIQGYMVALVNATRQHPDVYLGASPRGSLALYRAGQARAAMLGRSYLIPDDVKLLAVPTLAHRLIIHPSARLREVAAQRVIEEVLASVTVPGAPVPSRSQRGSGLEGR